MKLTNETEKRLRKLGFAPDNLGWWSLSDGWGFRLYAIRNFKHLRQRLKILAEKEGDGWTKTTRRVYRRLLAWQN